MQHAAVMCQHLMEPTHCLPGHVHGMVREWPGGGSHRCGDHLQPAKRWRMEDGGWREEGGGRREERGGRSVIV